MRRRGRSLHAVGPLALATAAIACTSYGEEGRPSSPDASSSPSPDASPAPSSSGGPPGSDAGDAGARFCPVPGALFCADFEEPAALDGFEQLVDNGALSVADGAAHIRQSYTGATCGRTTLRRDLALPAGVTSVSVESKVKVVTPGLARGEGIGLSFDDPLTKARCQLWTQFDAAESALWYATIPTGGTSSGQTAKIAAVLPVGEWRRVELSAARAAEEKTMTVSVRIEGVNVLSTDLPDMDCPLTEAPRAYVGIDCITYAGDMELHVDDVVARAQ